MPTQDEASAACSDLDAARCCAASSACSFDAARCSEVGLVYSDQQGAAVSFDVAGLGQLVSCLVCEGSYFAWCSDDAWSSCFAARSWSATELECGSICELPQAAMKKTR